MKKRTLESVVKPSVQNGFAKGLLFGLAAGGMVLPQTLPKARRPAKGIADDWKTVGRDMSAAMKHGRGQ